MRTTLTTTALALALLAAGAAGGRAQDAGGASTGSDDDKGGTTGTMTTTPNDASDDAVGTREGTMTGTDGATTGRLGEDDPLYGMRGEQIIGKTLYGANGEEIGEVDNVVMAQGGGPEAVVGVGGFLGVGERDITIPLAQIRMDGDRLTTSMTKESIGAVQPYERGRYQDWDRTRTFGGTAR
jgi:sporulation protein YlmC with PRC-barrel domain